MILFNSFTLLQVFNPIAQLQSIRIPICYAMIADFPNPRLCFLPVRDFYTDYLEFLVLELLILDLIGLFVPRRSEIES